MSLSSRLVGLDLSGYKGADSYNTGHLQGHLADRPPGGQAPSQLLASLVLFYIFILLCCFCDNH